MQINADATETSSASSSTRRQAINTWCLLRRAKEDEVLLTADFMQFIKSVMDEHSSVSQQLTQNSQGNPDCYRKGLCSLYAQRLCILEFRLRCIDSAAHCVGIDMGNIPDNFSSMYTSVYHSEGSEDSQEHDVVLFDDEGSDDDDDEEEEEEEDDDDIDL